VYGDQLPLAAGGNLQQALDGSILSLAAFIAVSIIIFLLFVLLQGVVYKFNTAVTAVHTKGNYKVRKRKTRGVLKTLIYRS
jgi:low affinity Fe/Cu permease